MSYIRALTSMIGFNAGCFVTSATRSLSIQTSRPSRNPSRYASPVRIISELPQRVAQQVSRVRFAGQAAALQRRHKARAHFRNESPTDTLKRRADQKPVAADSL